MNTGFQFITIVQTIIAVVLMLGVLSLLYWVIENPILRDEEMREVLELSRTLRADAYQQSRNLVRKESERLYR
jgi:hypothetical protein